MPILRYFVFVGGALLALLFAANYVVPASSVTQPVASASSEQPVIRIRSDRHLPERVVLDTSQPTIIPPGVKTAAVATPQPPVQTGTSAELAEMSAKAHVRETFAQLTPAQKPDAARKVEPKPKRKVARAHPAPQYQYQYGGPQYGRPMMVAQQPHFGLFNMTW
jgi:hypothetical protein